MSHQFHHELGTNVSPNTVIDPVCGMTVHPSHSAGSHIHRGTTYHFCSTSCRAKFKANPEQYLDAAAPLKSESEPPASQRQYTCPMHPEIVQDGPGTCPTCGMALEPVQPSPEEGPDPELVAMQRRFWVGAALTVPIVIIAMAGLIPSGTVMAFLHENMEVLNWVQLVLATPVVLWCGWPFFE